MTWPKLHPRSPMRSYGIVIALEEVVLLVAILGAGRILSDGPKPVQGVDRSAHESAVSASQSGLDAVTKENVGDTSMTVN